MEHYEKKISFLGENIQTIRKHRGMKQQELADKIGINMQSLSKIERGVNYPTFDTLEKIMDVLGVTPVSYTHLDVYKRQILERLCILIPILSASSCCFIFLCFLMVCMFSPKKLIFFI